MLPDSTAYFSHHRMRITTDIDLRNQRKLHAVTGYLDKKIPGEMTVPSEGWEVWLRDEGVVHKDFVPVRCWVNHLTRTMGYGPPPSDVLHESMNLSEDDSAYFF